MRRSDPLRCDADGKPYGRFTMCRPRSTAPRRLRWATSRARAGPRNRPRAGAPMVAAHDTWPATVEPDLVDVDVAISRTEPDFDGIPGVFEVRQLYLDAIASARRQLFFENQYFTSDTLCNALSARLRTGHPPEIMVISPKNQSGWLEQATMGALRARIHQRLKAPTRRGATGCSARICLDWPTAA